MQDTRVLQLLWLLLTYSGCGMYNQATPGLLNTCVTVCNEFASRQLSVSRSSTIVFSIYLVLNTNLVPWKMPLCIQIPFASLQCDSACFWRWVAVTSDHLDISSVWKLLVGSCVCGWKFEHTFSMCSSPAPKLSVHLWHKTLSSLAINAFVCSVISCWEVSSRGYLVTSDDTFVWSDIVFWGENWFRKPQKRTETRRKKNKGSEKSSFRVGMDLKTVHFE